MSETAEIRGGDRVSIEPGVHEVYRDLTEGSRENPEAAPFLIMKDVFMWAVALGVKGGERRPLTGSRQIFRWDQLSQDLDVPALRAIAIAETGDVEILVREDQILRIAEEYANAGVREIKASLIDQPAQSLWNLADLARSR